MSHMMELMTLLSTKTYAPSGKNGSTPTQTEATQNMPLFKCHPDQQFTISVEALVTATMTVPAHQGFREKNTSRWKTSKGANQVPK